MFNTGLMVAAANSWPLACSSFAPTPVSRMPWLASPKRTLHPTGRGLAQWKSEAQNLLPTFPAHRAHGYS